MGNMVYFYKYYYDNWKNIGWSPSSNTLFPAIILVDDTWNDYGYRTDFHVHIYKSHVEYEKEIGTLKILQKGEYVTDIETDSNKKFEKLSAEYCSLGSISYYKKIRQYFEDSAEEILLNLRDCALNEEIKLEFEKDEGFKVSLLRTLEHQKALQEAQGIIKGLSHEFNSIFSFKCNINGFLNQHGISFNFNPITKEKNLPHRIISLIGENGVGKTQFLSRLVLEMTGFVEKDEILAENFQPWRPLLNKVILISYSIFDSFKKPKQKKLKDIFNYEYFGLKDEQGKILSDEKLQEMIFESIKKIIDQHKKEIWFKLLSNLFSEEELSNLIDKIEVGDKIDLNNELQLSSGQGIIFNCITHLLANIIKETLVIFDEPEMHLHPKGISQLIKILYDLLEETNSYAILATHSP